MYHAFLLARKYSVTYEENFNEFFGDRHAGIVSYAEAVPKMTQEKENDAKAVLEDADVQSLSLRIKDFKSQDAKKHNSPAHTIAWGSMQKRHKKAR